MQIGIRLIKVFGYPIYVNLFVKMWKKFNNIP